MNSIRKKKKKTNFITSGNTPSNSSYYSPTETVWKGFIPRSPHFLYANTMAAIEKAQQRLRMLGKNKKTEKLLVAFYLETTDSILTYSITVQ